MQLKGLKVWQKKKNTKLRLRGAAHAPDTLVSLRDGPQDPKAGQTSEMDTLVCQQSEECRGSCNSTELTEDLREVSMLVVVPQLCSCDFS